MSIRYLSEQSRLSSSTINVKELGAKGDGSDDTAIIQTAFNMVAGGGSVYFPCGIYGISSTINVSGIFPINAYGEMGSNYSVGLLGSFICPLNSISGSLFKWNAAGSTINGLYFKDPTSNLNTGAQGSRSITACLELDLFSTGSVILCNCDGILGSFIKSRRWVRGRILDCHVRDTGDTNKPAIFLNGESDVAPTQAIAIQNLHIEVCRSAPYIYCNQYSPGARIMGGQFEADQVITGSNYPFVYSEAANTLITDCGFSVNSGPSIHLKGLRCTVSNCIIEGAPTYPSPKLWLGSNLNNISNVIFQGTPSATGICIQDSGNNYFGNCQVYFDGQVKLGNASNFCGGSISNSKTALGYAVECNTDSILNGCTVSNNAGGGIKAAAGAVISGNIIVSNSGIGLRCETPTAVIIANRASNNVGGDFSFTSYPHAYLSNANHLGDSIFPLQASGTWNPTSLSAGQSTSQNLTVTGATINDVAIVNFPVVASGSGANGLQISASIYTNNTVKVTITNNTAGAIDLDSANFVVKVLKL